MRSRPQVPLSATPEIVTTTAAPLSPPSVEARLLVISADGKEVALSAIRQALAHLGTPYSLYIVKQNEGGLTPDVLVRGNTGRYQGIILTTGSLAHFDGKGWRSALSPEEWTHLANYQVGFGVRQVTWYTYPNELYGFRTMPVPRSTGHKPLEALVTEAGAGIFSYLNTSNPVVIRDAYAYLAKANGTDTVPLLEDAAGNALAVIRRYADGRENLALTFDNSQYLVHSVALAYGLINWVTRGFFLGYRRVYLSAQVDDFFLDDDIYGGGAYRMSGADLERTAEWQAARQRNPLLREFKLDMVFNGWGTEPGYMPADTLLPTASSLKDRFKWISHTWTHPDLNDISYGDAVNELVRNNQTATRLGLEPYSVEAVVTPKVSGLYNPEAMRAMRDTGVRYVVSDTSRPGENNPTPNTGIYNALEPSILELPRRPTNLFYNVSTPAEWRAEYNALYRGYWKRALTYEEILDKESDVLLMYVIRGENNPWMFHQANLRAYDGTRTLLTDLLDRLLAKYQAIYQLPARSPTMEALGVEVGDFTRYMATDVTAVITDRDITLSSTRDVVVPVTGLDTPGADRYGGQPTTFVPVRAGRSVTLPRSQP